ncbi:amidohydrolase family protein [Nocardioides sp. zg-579]|uniref:Amidohydrolase family protein n=1 Tax=Nocardioides marmotae TaxID=2663857 RepID=A0A6I3IZ63_9ACTN|nr:D-aminoacylase [Nocardioides marmotae]MCR6030743.1 amidohydrolase family protein [Gordonia jinghuaiqii]MTB94377.1 amidohydrolase family protein [Nocardioides marmotae]QKE01597.1 D-aminoacylase [Nocardioides marmotae]
MDADVLVRGATVVDGTGREAYVADVAIAGDRVVAVGDLAGQTARRVVEAEGLVLCPGFIDIHTHSDVSLLHDPAGESKVLQGVTTEVPGNCGFSAFPLAEDRLDLHSDHLARIGDDVLPPAALTWRDLDGYAAKLEQDPPTLNVAPLVGHGTVRVAVMGVDQRPPTDDELDRMRRLVAESLEQGAFGLSTGLTHIPSGYGDTDEVRELVRVVAEHGALYATHARTSATPEGFPEVEEAIDTCRSVGARLQFSHAAINEPHKWGQAGDVVGLFERAEAAGLDVGFDVYPYDASASSLTQYLPPWVQAGGTEGLRRLLADPDTRARAERDLAAGWMDGIPWFWDRVLISRAGPGHDHLVGRSLEEAAHLEGVDPVTLTLDLCLAHGNSVQVVLFYRTEDDMTTFLAHRLSLVGSDGSAVPLDQGGLKPHPRGFGTFPRVLGRYVREQGLLSLPAAVHKMTGAVAERLQLPDRGVVRPGAVADLVLLDPATVVDRATFTEPTQAPVGIVQVLVNGTSVVEDGRLTGARPGRVLRRTTVARRAAEVAR